MKKVKGYTIVELVVVIALIGILALVSIVKIFDFSTFNSRSDIDRAYTLLNQGRKIAIAQRKNIYLNYYGKELRLCYANVTSSCSDANTVKETNGVLALKINDNIVINSGIYFQSDGTLSAGELELTFLTGKLKINNATGYIQKL